MKKKIESQRLVRHHQEYKYINICKVGVLKREGRERERERGGHKIYLKKWWLKAYEVK